MPRVKCNFCDNFLKAKPMMFKRKGYTPRCLSCNDKQPPEGWRCQGITNNGNQCKRWVKGEGETTCTTHEVKL